VLAVLGRERYTVKKGYPFPVPSRDVTNQTFTGRELFKYFRPGRVWLESFAGERKTANLFLQCTTPTKGDMSLLLSIVILRDWPMPAYVTDNFPSPVKILQALRPVIF
jgi:hypothetical protein